MFIYRFSVFFNEIFNTYHAKNRYGVIGNKKPNVKDFYLVMLSKNEDLPDFLKGVEHDLLMKNRDRNVFMGVIVITKNIVEMMTKSPKNVDNLAKEKVEKAPKRQRPSRFSAEIAVPKPVVSSTASADPRRRANVPVEVPVIPSVPVQAAPVPMFQPPQNTPSFPQPSAASVDAVSLLNSIAGSIPGFIPLPTTQQIPETQQNISGYPSMQFQNTNTFVKSQPGVNGFPNPYMNFNVPHGGPSYNMGMSQQNMHTGPLPIDPRATQKRDGTWNRHPK